MGRNLLVDVTARADPENLHDQTIINHRIQHPVLTHPNAKPLPTTKDHISVRIRVLAQRANRGDELPTQLRITPPDLLQLLGGPRSSPLEWCICPFDKTGSVTVSGTGTSLVLGLAHATS